MIASFGISLILAVGSAQSSETIVSTQCTIYAEQIVDAAVVDQALRRNWEPGVRQVRPADEPGPIYSDTVAFHIEMAHEALITRFVDECAEWITHATATEISGRSIWLLMQHHRLAEWQYDHIGIARSLYQRDFISPREYALFVDRAWWRNRQEQRYGTQGRCTADGFEPFPINGEEDVNDRRRLIGLPTLEDELARMNREACGAVE